MVRTIQPAVVAVMLVVLALASPAVAAVAPGEVDEAVKWGVAFLYSKQKNGNWEAVQERDPKKEANSVEGGQWGELSSVAALALLSAGEDPQKQPLLAGIEFIKGAEMHGIAALSMRAQVWPLMPDASAVRRFASRDCSLLKQGLKAKLKGKGTWGYLDDPKDSDSPQFSTSAFAVLGLHAATQMEIEVPSDVWVMVNETYRKQQHPDGGWSAQPDDGKASAAITTCGGITTLVICNDQMLGARMSSCNGNVPDEATQKAIGWVEAHYAEVAKGGGRGGALFAIERAGAITGRKYFGDKDWFNDIAATLIKSQKKDGSWGNVLETSFALMFLSHGRSPIIMNKLEYVPADLVAGDAGATTADVPAAPTGPPVKPGTAYWSNRPRDVPNLARWVGHETEQDLNFQIVNFTHPADDLLDSPILFIAGSKMLKFTPEQEQKLKRLVEDGGLIVANADCGENSKAFTDSFLALGRRLFPSYDFRELPKDHIIFTGEQFKPSPTWKMKSLLGMSNGARELMLLIPEADVARAWQLNQVMSSPGSYEIGADIFLYSVDRNEPREKGDTYLVKSDPRVKATSKVRIARLQYGGNWDPEPGGWRRLGNIMHNELAIDVSVTPVEIGKGQLDSSYKLADLTGIGRFRLDDAAREEIKKFVNEGGTLLVDAAGGDADFAASAGQELSQLFAGSSPDLLSKSHPVYVAGGKIDEIEFRRFARKSMDFDRGLHLKGIDIANRTAVFFSPEDLAVGMVGEPVDGINGYEPGTATDLARNIVAYSTGLRIAPPSPIPTTGPATKPGRRVSPPKKPTTKATTPKPPKPPTPR